MAYNRSIGFGWNAQRGHAQPVPAASPARADVEQMVKKLIDERRKRCSCFPAGLFADPAWDILLVLALTEARQQRLILTRLCNSVDIPATTALRWVNRLVDEGLVVRRADVNDKRRSYIELSAGAYATMIDHCSAPQTPISLAA